MRPVRCVSCCLVSKELTFKRVHKTQILKYITKFLYLTHRNAYSKMWNYKIFADDAASEYTKGHFHVLVECFFFFFCVGTALGSASCLSVYTSLQAHNILTHTDHTISHTLAHPSSMGFPSMLIIHFNEYIKQPFYCYSYYYEWH